MIHVRQLTKDYADLRAASSSRCDGVSFDAVPGQIYGLLGPNGAGKTTALRILSTVLRPTGGTASVNGFDVVTQPRMVRHQIGFMSANTAVYDRMTAWEMVEYFGRLYGMADEPLRERMEAAVRRGCKMNEIRDLLGAKMSTGMKQKVSIARAIVHDPPVLIFDEATTGLDVLVARALLKTVAELRDQGKCIVFSTHIMREAEKLCDRIAIMHRGHILAEGTLEELRDQHEERDLEELFFRLIQHHDDITRTGRLATASWPSRRMNWSNVKLILLPRDSRSTARSADAVHDRRAAAAALSAVGHELLPGLAVHARARDSRAGGRRARSRRTCRRWWKTTTSPTNLFADPTARGCCKLTLQAATPRRAHEPTDAARAGPARHARRATTTWWSIFRPNFAERVRAVSRRAACRPRGAMRAAGRANACPASRSIRTWPRTRRKAAYRRVSDVLDRWREADRPAEPGGQQAAGRRRPGRSRSTTRRRGRSRPAQGGRCGPRSCRSCC